MENKDENVIEITTHSDFMMSEATTSDVIVDKNTKTTNPIAKNFSKFVHRSKDKFSLKDIFR